MAWWRRKFFPSPRHPATLPPCHSFTLHPILAADTHIIGDLPLCRMLLMDNAYFPWLILVPKRDALRELFDLTPADYTTVMQEVRDTARRLAELTGAHKINIAALGNQVEQLHIHIIARFREDAAWPNPVWGHAPAQPYTQLPGWARKLAQRLMLADITKM